ncbi:MAG: NigD-like protein [Tannerellaceae bacterium]|nr:NigD-like protein [Tannerellaceae bacterium]
MSMRKLTLFMLGTLVISSLFFSCNDDNVLVVRSGGYKSWFTVKAEDDSFYFLHDKGKTFLPVGGIKNYAPERDHRAFVYYEVALEKDHQGYDYPVYVHHMDTILSKSLVADLGDENEKVYGKDPVRIDRMWVGGGFLTIRFSTYWGGREAHFVNLVQENEDNPFELTFRHNAYDDPKHSWGYGWVAFDLADLPAPAEGEDSVELTVKVHTYEGVLEKTFTYTAVTENAEDPDDSENDDDTTGRMMLM